jgi:Ser/Thr protein kinase RdoA (MazF antagonist)
VSLESALNFAPLASEMSVAEVVREAVGRQTAVRLTEWHVRRDNYVVASVETRRPAMRLVVKLEIPGERPNRHLDSMAAIARMVRTHTEAPTFHVVAVDVTRQKWPWEYLIVTELVGDTWAKLYPRLDHTARAVGQRQIGRSAAQLHALRFDLFGQIGPDGAVVDGTGAVAALRRRAQQRIRTSRYRDLMLDVLEWRSSLFERLPAPTLCHEDMNPYNLVFDIRDGLPVLSGILDFESAWASTGESDLARLELWRLTGGSALREGYSEIDSAGSEYRARKPVLQLLWCLEYAEHNASAEHQAVTDRVCRELGIESIQLA